MTKVPNQKAGSPIDDDPFIRVLKKISDRNVDPRVLVLVAHGQIELMINTLVSHFCKNGKRITVDHRSFPHSAKLIILNEKQILADPLFETLDRFRKLRNDAAHEPFFEVNEDRIRGIAEPMERYFPLRESGVNRPSENLSDFCRFIVHNLFAQFQGILLPKFAPALHKAMTDPLTPLQDSAIKKETV
jgi:hypothetical protein